MRTVVVNRTDESKLRTHSSNLRYFFKSQILANIGYHELARVRSPISIMPKGLKTGSNAKTLDVLHVLRLTNRVIVCLF